VIDKGEVMVAKGTLTIHGVSKSDAGAASNFEQSLGAVSHCFKRAAVHWGIGRYLYNLPMNWVSVEKGGRIPEAILRELRAKLPRPGGEMSALDLDAELPSAQVRETPATLLHDIPSAPQRASAPSEAHPARRAQAQAVESAEPLATEKQIASIRKLCEAL